MRRKGSRAAFPANSPSLTLRAIGTSTERSIGLDVAGRPGRRWTFFHPRGVFADPRFLEWANHGWAEIEAWLPTRVAGPAPARLEIHDLGQDGLPLAYVVTVLDLLLGVGIRDVTLVEEGLRLTMPEPPGRPAGKR